MVKDRDPPPEVETRVLGERAVHGAAAQVPAKLVVVGGPDEGLELPLDAEVCIGTEPSCDLVLADATVSRRHAVVQRVGGRYTVKDLSSLNGTFLGGTRVVEAVVPLGAVLTLGESAIAIQPRLHMREVSPTTSRRFGELYGESVAMRELFAILERVSTAAVTVLIEGESGTGKELVARSIHQASPRAQGPYVVFDCASVPRDLAESELFGHKRGAFSGAVEDRFGAFQRAHGGTICLDEIGELPLELQPKLLRVLETAEVQRVGDDVPKKVDVRVLAATNRELGAEARRGNFRTDLLYRLEVVKIRMPPLRHRPEDVPGLVAELLAGRIPPEEVEGENLHRLLAYSWPGNVRELRNVLDRAVALGQAPGKPLRFADLVFNLGPTPQAPLTIGANYPGVASPMPFKQAKEQLLAGFERSYVEALLARSGGNITRAAAEAGLSRKHLYDLIKRCTGGS